jgi:diguanylate cyclase (GGDEF)-like protein/PAS domain S-box-containing protein
MHGIPDLCRPDNTDGPEAGPELVKDRDKLRAELLRAQEHLRLWTAVFEQSAEGVMICDAQKRILTVNVAFEKITGYLEAEAVGHTPAMLHSGRQDRAFYVDLWLTVNAAGSWQGEICNRRKDGVLYLEWLTIRAVYDQHQNATHYIGIFSDLTDRKAAEASARHKENYDPLTELPNRGLLVRRLQQLTTAARQSGENIAVLFIDLDRFSDINESMGHDAGDVLLQAVARRISSAVRHSDIVARLSADEFIALVPALLDSGDAAVAADTLLDEIRGPVSINGQDLVISASIGIAIFPNDGADPQELIRHAAAAMSQIKRERRNAYLFYTPEMNDRAAERLRTENALRLALERHELVLHYQPQIDLVSGAIVGAEALVRWHRPGEGLVMPTQFIPIAEECGLIVRIGNWVIGEAVRQVQAWNAQGVAPITVAINISAVEFRQPGFADRIAQELRVRDIAPSRLELEMTEGIAVRDVELTTQTLMQLHRLGVHLSLDDFGTGYSSLSYLRRFPFDKIKIDQSFIREMTDRPEAIRIVRAIIGLAHNFEMRVIAEGVETPQQLAALRAERCDELQGFLVSRALPADDFLRFQGDWQGLS